MDKALIRRRFSKAAATYAERADVQREIARRMARLVRTYVPVSERKKVVEVGCGTGTFTRDFLRHERPERMWLNDLCPEMEVPLKDVLRENVSFLPGDAETVDFPDGQDLFVSCSAIQWFEHPEEFFVKCHARLREGGYWAFSTFGPRNMEEVAALTSATLPYRSQAELRRELERIYRVLYSREDLIRLTFASPMEVLKHLKETGVTGIGGRTWTRQSLAEFCRRYEQRYPSPEGGVLLTYHPIYMIAKK